MNNHYLLIGNVYVADRDNHRIRKVTVSTGILTTIAGSSTSSSYSGDNGAATSARLSYPCGVALDSSGNVYIADTYNDRIRKVVVVTGIITTIAGTGASSYSGDGGAATSAALYNPSGIAIDSSRNIFIADSYNNRIRKITAETQSPTAIPTVTPSLTPSTSIPSIVPTVIPTARPSVIPSIIPTANPSVTPTTIMPTVIPTARPSVIPTVIPTADNIITTIAGTGVSSYSGDGSVATSATLYSPYGVALDASGSSYFLTFV